ncbi:MAG: ABC transporter substrate-binding protein [Planctomycetales bacterium]
MTFVPWRAALLLSLGAFIALSLTLAVSPPVALAQPPGPQPAPAVEPAPDDPPLPLFADMQVPPPAELLEKPRDWIVLKDQRVIVAMPIYPRPGTLDKIEAQLEAAKRVPLPREPKARRKQQEERAALEYLTVQLPDEPLLYRLHRDHVEQIIHYEDHMLQQASRLTDAGKFREAFELVFLVARRNASWPGLAEAEQRLLFAQGTDHLDQDRPEAALAAFEDLHVRNNQYPQLAEQLGRVADRLISAAEKEQDFRRARHFLERLTNLEPQHPVGTNWRTDFEGRAQGLLTAAERAAAGSRHDEAADAVARAAEIWPRLPTLRPAFERMLLRFQTLRVGVLRLPLDPSPTRQQGTDDAGNVLADAAERRHLRLTRSRLFEPGRTDRITRFRTDHFDLWEPTDLGRRIEFFLRPGRPTWDPRPVVTAADVVRELQERLDETGPRFDERLAGYVESATVVAPHQFEVRFRRVPLRPEPLLSIAVGVEAGDGSRLPAGAFRVHERTGDSLVYRRTRPEPNELKQYHVAEIVERRFDSHDQAVQALLRGEVDLLPRVQPWAVPALREDEGFVVRQETLPATHVVQFHPASPVATSRELRRALAYAIDRERILKETVLRGAPAEFGRVVSGPFPSRSFAYDGLVPPRRPNRTLAYTLAFSASKGMGGALPKLRMLCCPDPLARVAAARLVEEWKQIGLDVELLDAESATLADRWDLVYRTVRMSDPLTELWPFLTLDSQARVAGLAALPDWLRQEVIDLEYAADWKTAEERLRRVHRHLAAEAQLLPLWEVEEFQVARRTVNPAPDANQRPIATYDGIEQWIVEPWYPTDKP